MISNVPVKVTFPRSRLTYTFKSIRAVARMLSGNGTASGGLRKTINEKAYQGWTGGGDNVVRNNALAG